MNIKARLAASLFFVSLLLLISLSAAAQVGEKEKQEKEAERAYKRSLGNIPNQGPTDPWGNVRSESAPKAAAKGAPAKRTKTDIAN